MEKILKIGQIVNAQGIRGEVRVYPLTNDKEIFEELEWVYMDGNYEEKVYIEKVRYKNNLAILKLKGIDDRNMAEACKTKYLSIDRENMKELEEDEYFITDLIGLKVYTDEKELIGNIKKVIQTAGHDLYEIKSEDPSKKNILIPVVEEFVKEINVEEGFVTVKLIEGLIE